MLSLVEISTVSNVDPVFDILIKLLGYYLYKKIIIYVVIAVFDSVFDAFKNVRKIDNVVHDVTLFLTSVSDSLKKDKV